MLQSTTPAAAPSVDVVKQAEALAAEHHLEQANALLTEFLRRDATNSAVLIALGRVQLSQGISEDALRSFEKVLSVEPVSEGAREGEVKAAIAAALADQKIGLDGDALLNLIRARKLVPDSPELLFAFGMQAERMRIFKDADEALGKAHELVPQDLRILYALAHVQMDEQKMAEAEANLKAYLQQKPEDATAHYGLGLLLHMVLRNDEAKAEFQRSLELQPRQSASYFQLGEMARESDVPDEAKGYYEKVLALAPHHGGALTGEGILALRAKDYATAEKYLESAVQYAPDYATAHHYLAIVYARMGRAEDSKRESDRANILSKQDSKARRGSFLTVIE
ncbi:MAG TPA: tetratricopeptide repeat protein [Terracidiphilus sp.]|nr:tetratricopeptide repeat protein [Terracidiphilus sp.]